MLICILPYFLVFLVNQTGAFRMLAFVLWMDCHFRDDKSFMQIWRIKNSVWLLYSNLFTEWYLQITLYVTLFFLFIFLSDGVVSSLFCAWRCISFIMFIIHDGSILMLWESAAFIKYHFIKLMDCSWHKCIHNIFKEDISRNQLVSL